MGKTASLPSAVQLTRNALTPFNPWVDDLSQRSHIIPFVCYSSNRAKHKLAEARLAQLVPCNACISDQQYLTIPTRCTAYCIAHQGRSQAGPWYRRTSCSLSKRTSSLSAPLGTLSHVKSAAFLTNLQTRLLIQTSSSTSFTVPSSTKRSLRRVFPSCVYTYHGTRSPP